MPQLWAVICVGDLASSNKVTSQLSRSSDNSQESWRHQTSPSYLILNELGSAGETEDNTAELGW